MRRKQCTTLPSPALKNPAVGLWHHRVPNTWPGLVWELPTTQRPVHLQMWLWGSCFGASFYFCLKVQIMSFFLKMVFRVFYQKKKKRAKWKGNRAQFVGWCRLWHFWIMWLVLSGAVKVAFPYIEGDLGFPWLLLARIPHLIPRPQMHPISLVSGPLSNYVRLGGTSIWRCPLLYLEGTEVWQFRRAFTPTSPPISPHMTPSTQSFKQGSFMKHHLSLRSCTCCWEYRSKSPQIGHLVLNKT